MMGTKIVDAGWSEEIRSALDLDASELRIISPFIKLHALSRIPLNQCGRISVITRYNLSDFADGVSDIESLRCLLNSGARVRGIRNLHSKVYLFGARRAIVTSANLTSAAFDRNLEFGIVSDTPEIVLASGEYFNHLWALGGVDLTFTQLDVWEKTVTNVLTQGNRSADRMRLQDFGADAGLVGPQSRDVPIAVSDARQAFVKFLGEGDNRIALSASVLDQVARAGCHWALAYPASKRPRAVQDGAVMFIARLTRDPNDICIFGRAIGMQYVPGRDDASAEEIADRSWKATWSRYIRVHHAEFVAGTLSNGVSLNQMMNALGPNSFAVTKRNAAQGIGNVDPRRAYLQQPAVELSDEGLTWLRDRLQSAFDLHGTVPQTDLDKLDWPAAM